MCLPVVALAAAAAATGLMMSSSMKKSSPTPLAATPTPQEVKEADIKNMRKANEANNMGVNAGTASTMLTGPRGVSDPLELGKTKLLGQ